LSAQLVKEVAGVVLKLTALDPCELPKFTPVIVTWVPCGPDAGVTFEMIGVVPKVMETLSNVAMVVSELLSLLSAKPI